MKYKINFKSLYQMAEIAQDNTIEWVHIGLFFWLNCEFEDREFSLEDIQENYNIISDIEEIKNLIFSLIYFDYVSEVINE